MLLNFCFKTDDELLLRLVTDSEFRNEIPVEIRNDLPSPVSRQNFAFVELIIRSSQETPNPKFTCLSGFTIVCNSPENPDFPVCVMTCAQGFTTPCDRNTDVIHPECRSFTLPLEPPNKPND